MFLIELVQFVISFFEADTRNPVAAKGESQSMQTEDGLTEIMNDETQRTEWRALEKSAEEAARARVEDKIADIEMEFRNKPLWDSLMAKPDMVYEGIYLPYAERWAKLMQAEMQSGKTLPEIADAASYEADFEGMSGSSFSCALHALVDTWVYGEELAAIYDYML